MSVEYLMTTNEYKLCRSKKFTALEHMMSEAAFVWNHALALQKRYYSLAKTFGWEVKYISCKRMQHHFKMHVARTRLGAQTVQEILQRQDNAFHLFFNHTNKRPPKFRKAKDFTSFVFKQDGYKLYGNEFIINKISKRFKFFKSRDWEGKVKIVRVFRSHGDWFILVVTDAEPKPCGKSHTGASAGIDFGLKTFMTFSDGRKIEAPQFYKKLLRKVQKWQRLLSKSEKGSAHYWAYRRQLNRVYAELANKRTDWFYKTAHMLCREYDYLFIEDLVISGMAKMKHWGRKVNDLGWTGFVKVLGYIASKYGTTVHKIDRWYPSSKLCDCGYKNTGLQLSDRDWTCPVCGQHHLRDAHAAMNIYRRGVAELESICKTCTSVATAG